MLGLVGSLGQRDFVVKRLECRLRDGPGGVDAGPGPGGRLVGLGRSCMAHGGCSGLGFRRFLTRFFVAFVELVVVDLVVAGGGLVVVLLEDLGIGFNATLRGRRRRSRAGRSSVAHGIGSFG
jgi:hypothetical protein